MKSLLVFLLVFSVHLSAFAQLDIWKGVKGKPKVEMTAYLAPGSGNKAVVICPGGSYFWHATETEGHAVARWLQSQGISGFVLNYRVAKVFAFMFPYRLIARGTRYPDAQDDLRQALKLIRAHADEWGIAPHQVGAMGFSAGGHLVMSGAELFAPAERPDFVAPIYPVVTMEADCVHKRSRRALLGDSRKHNRQLRDLLSLEKHVPSDCPPVFLINCKDDPTVDYHNSLLLDSALTAQHVPHTYQLYQTGGHGFGADGQKGTAECRQWKKAFLQWVSGLTLK